ncbi:hypothetical protein [Clostridium diolis]|nr:hypothetical protein [Clostridium diolis]
MNRTVTIVDKWGDSFSRNFDDVYFDSNGAQASLCELLCKQGLREHKFYK